MGSGTFGKDAEQFYQWRNYADIVNESVQQDGASGQEIRIIGQILNQSSFLGIKNLNPVPVNMLSLGHGMSKQLVKKYTDLLIARGVLEEVPNGDLLNYVDARGNPLKPGGICKEDEKHWRTFIIHPVYAQVKKGLTYWADIEKEQNEEERQREKRRKSTKAGQAYYARKQANAKKRRAEKPKKLSQSNNLPQSNNVVNMADFTDGK